MLNKQKTRSRRPTSCIDRMATPLGNRVEPTACVCFFFLLLFIFWVFILFALFILCNINCKSFHFLITHACYLFVYSHTSQWTHKSSGPELVLFKIRKERFRWQVWLMSIDAHLDFRLDCNSPYATGIVEFSFHTHVI